MLFSIAIVGALAQTKTDTIKSKCVKLNEVIVNGKLAKSPVYSMKINCDKKVIQPKNVADLFSELNGFSVVKRGNYAIDPSFRANIYEQLNVMYDGGTKAVHACPNRMDPITTHIIPEEIAKIEVIKGPFTVRYGATFGGIVNLVTKDVAYREDGFHGTVSGGYESNGNSFVTMLELEQVTDKFDIVGNLGYRNFGNYKDGAGIKIPSAFKSTDYGVKAGYNITENQRLQAHWRQSFGSDVKHAGLPMDTETDDSSVFSMDYKARNVGTTLKTITAKGFYSYVDHLMNNKNRKNLKKVFASAPVTSTNTGGKLEFELALHNDFNMFVGTDLNHIERTGTRTRTMKMKKGKMLPKPMVKTDKIWQDAYINDLGFFTEATYDLGEKTALTLGARIDLVSANAEDLEKDFANKYNGKTKQNEVNASGMITLKHKFDRVLFLELALGRGVRTANMAERFINHFTIGSDMFEYLGNPLLKPEVNNQIELGLKGVVDFDMSTRLTYQVSTYYSKFDNYIMGVVNKSVPKKYMMTKPAFAKVFTNITDANKYGFELGLKLNVLNDYYVRTDVAYVKTENKDFNESLPLNPPFTSKISLGVDKSTYWANATYNIVSKQTNIAKTFGEKQTEGWQTLDIKAGIKPFKNVTFGIACLNVFDKNYINHLNFAFKNQKDFKMTKLTEQGRNFTAFLKYEF